MDDKREKSLKEKNVNHSSRAENELSRSTNICSDSLSRVLLYFL